jgi:hypothetical protein
MSFTNGPSDFNWYLDTTWNHHSIVLIVPSHICQLYIQLVVVANYYYHIVIPSAIPPFIYVLYSSIPLLV